MFSLFLLPVSASVDETSSSASCSTEPQTRLSRSSQVSSLELYIYIFNLFCNVNACFVLLIFVPASLQSGRQRKKSVMMPRVVLTPLKVNGEHVPSGYFLFPSLPFLPPFLPLSTLSAVVCKPIHFDCGLTVFCNVTY